MRGTSPSVLLWASLVLLALGLALPIAAQAHREPTGRERARITRAAALAQGGSTLTVRVSDIKVSTVGTWATATVSIYRKAYMTKPEMVVQDTFFKAHGKWFDTAYNRAPTRTPSKAVVSDLGLPANPAPTRKTGHTSHTTAIIVAAALGLLFLGGLGGVSARSRTASGPPDSDDHSSGRRLGGHLPDSTPTYQPPRPEKCPTCNGTGKTHCYSCGGAGEVRDMSNPNPANSAVAMVRCPSCYGERGIRCTGCGGSGTITRPF